MQVLSSSCKSCQPKHCCHNSYTKPINLPLQKTNSKRCDIVWRHLPTTLIAKAVLSSSDSNYWLHSCRALMLSSVGQSTNKDKAGLHLFSMKFTVIQRKTNCKGCDSMWMHLPTTIIVKAVLSSSDSTIVCTPADLWCQTAWDNQLTKTKLGSAYLVWNSHRKKQGKNDGISLLQWGQESIF